MHLKLSSEGTLVVKYVGPIAAICFLAFFCFAPLGRDEQYRFVAVVLAAAVTAHAFYRSYHIKDAYLDGDSLVVSSGQKTDRVRLEDIQKVTQWPLGNWRSVWVTFSKPTKFGTRIMFMDKLSLFNIGASDSGDLLKRSVDIAKTDSHDEWLCCA